MGCWRNQVAWRGHCTTKCSGGVALNLRFQLDRNTSQDLVANGCPDASIRTEGPPYAATLKSSSELLWSSMFAELRTYRRAEGSGPRASASLRQPKAPGVGKINDRGEHLDCRDGSRVPVFLAIELYPCVQARDGHDSRGVSPLVQFIASAERSARCRQSDRLPASNRTTCDC
jgi:hypothetical protein